MKTKIKAAAVWILTMLGYALAGAVMAILGIIVNAILNHYLW